MESGAHAPRGLSTVRGMKSLTIGELAKRSGVNATALRYYEGKGILPPPARISGRRRYGADAIRRVEVLRFAQQAGFSLQEIRTLFHGFESRTPLSARWQKMARAKIQELELLATRIGKMKKALQLGLNCGCMRIEDCLLSAKDADEPDRAASRGCCG